jgi:molecular chaperone GrpE
VHQQLLTAFAGQGVIFFACVGQAFDPARHEAIEVVERSDLPDNTVLEEINRGCTWRGQVLRCAQVVLARNPG